jgi:hypothetical protein
VGDDVHFAGTGTVTVVGAVLSPYDIWANLHAGGGNPDEDYNHDGVQNGIAYFMGMNDLATNPGVVGGKVTWQKDEANFDGGWQVQTSSNLITWTDVIAKDNGYSVEYTLPPGAGKLFVRLVVTPTSSHGF